MIGLGHLVGILFIPFKGFIEKRQQKIVQKYLKDPNSISGSEKHMILKDLTWKEYNAGNFEVAEKYSRELLRINNVIEENWNHGNAIHHAHTIIGLVRFDDEDIDSAKNHLVKSSKTTGSPQLDSFGPTFLLAQKMVEAGESESCEKFLNNCSQFWKMDNGRIAEWLKEIERGEIPQMYEYQ